MDAIAHRPEVDARFAFLKRRICCAAAVRHGKKRSRPAAAFSIQWER